MNDGAQHPTRVDAVPVEADEGAAREKSAGRLGLPASFGIGVAAAVLGLLPWLITGMRLPLQNLWATPTDPDSMPIVLLPFSQYAITLLAGLLITGSAIAGLVGRATRGRRVRGGLRAMALGVLLVQGVAAFQTSVVVGDGLEPGDRSDLYLTALNAVVILSILIGVVVLVLAARAEVPGAAVALTIGAIASGIWANSLVAPFGSLPTEWTSVLLALTRWVPAILVGIVIAWCGFRTASRVLTVAAALLLLWIAPAAITAVAAAAGTRVLAAYPAEMLDYGVGVFRMAVGLSEVVLPPILIALALGILGQCTPRIALQRRS